jgi:hypothetical protein
MPKQELRENYRIPTIDEFVDGFEFEVWSDGYFIDSVEDFCGWYPYTFGLDNWRDIEDIEEELEAGNVQVYFPNQPDNNQARDQDYRNSMQGNGRGVFVNVPRFLPPGAVEEILNNMLQGVDSSKYIEGDPDAGIQTGWALKPIHHLATPPDGSLGGDRFIDWKWEHSHKDEYFRDITVGPPEEEVFPSKFPHKYEMPDGSVIEVSQEEWDAFLDKLDDIHRHFKSPTPPETLTIPIKPMPIFPPLILPSEIRESRRQRREKARKK